MLAFLVAFSFSLLVTSLFALRFPDWRTPRALALYFALFFAVEWIASRMILPPGALGMETVGLCLGLTILVSIAIVASNRFEDEANR